MATVVITSREGGYTDGYINYKVSHRRFRVHPDGQITGYLGYIVDPYELGLIRAAVNPVTSIPPNPMATMHSGRPRTNMHHLYFGGYYHLGLYGRDSLRVTYRPTEIGPDGKPQDFHAKFEHSKRSAA